MADSRVIHEPELNRYALLRGDERIGMLDYLPSGDGVVFTHVEIDRAYRNQGHAEQLTREALAHAHGRGLRIAARCPYVAAYLRRHPLSA